MLLIVGLVVVFGGVIGGYLMDGGALGVLNQPAEFVIIGGAAIGSLLVSTPSRRAEEHRRPDQGRDGAAGRRPTTTSTCWRCCTSCSSRCSSRA